MCRRVDIRDSGATRAKSLSTETPTSESRVVGTIHWLQRRGGGVGAGRAVNVCAPPPLLLATRPLYPFQVSHHHIQKTLQLYERQAT